MFVYCYLKLFSILKNKKNMENMPFLFYFIFSEKHKKQKTLNLKNREEFSNNTFLVFFVFSKIILKNIFQKHESNFNQRNNALSDSTLSHFLAFTPYTLK